MVGEIISESWATSIGIRKADRQEKLMCVFGRRADQRDTEKLEPGCV
jgi:hypothetical protein